MTVKGKYVRTLWRNEKDGFTKYLIKLGSVEPFGTDLIYCMGHIPKLGEMTPVAVSGEMDTQQAIFRADAMEIDCCSADTMQEYILSCLPKGCGQAMAKKITDIVATSGLSLRQFLMERPDELYGLKGFLKEKAERFMQRASGQVMVCEIYAELAPHGGALKQAEKVYDAYHQEAVAAMHRDPYKVLAACSVPFPVMDSYAYSLQFGYCDWHRIEAIVHRGYQSIIQQGHTYLPYADLLRNIRYLEHTSSRYAESIPEAALAVAMFHASNGTVVEQEGVLRFYHKGALRAEEYIAERLRHMAQQTDSFLLLDEVGKELEETSLDPGQKDSVMQILQDYRASLLIGGPGTGKTATIKELVKVISGLCPGKSVALCAPTGRAAERIEEATGYRATTIHVLLEYRKLCEKDASPNRNDMNPLDQDVVIVDEGSMVGIFLFQQLLKAMRPGAKLILVGDWNQLESIEPGNILQDLAASGLLRVCQLTQNHRQSSEGRSIVSNSQLFIKYPSTPFVTDSHFQIHDCGSNEEAVQICKDMYRQYGAVKELDRMCLIVPNKKGEAGIEKINKEIQDMMQGRAKPSGRFRKGDKVMTTKNNYDADCPYANGDIWRIEEITHEGLFLQNSHKSLHFPKSNLEDLTLAYAMTVHKCQGSEGDIIVLVLPEDCPHSLISGSLLYTAITRARYHLLILSVNGSLEKFKTAPFRKARYTSLLEKLK